MFKLFVDHFTLLAAAGMRLMLRAADMCQTLAENVGPKWMQFSMHGNGHHKANRGRCLSQVFVYLQTCIIVYHSSAPILCNDLRHALFRVNE